jgi:hypothetical protein
LERAEMLLDESAKGAAVLPQILNELSKLRVELVSAATKSEHVPISALLHVAKVYNGILKSLCLVIAALVVWLTGAKALLSDFEIGFSKQETEQHGNTDSEHRIAHPL